MIKNTKKMRQNKTKQINNYGHYIKIKTVDGMTIYTPKVDIREVCVIPCYNSQDPAKQTKKNISFFINYTTIQGDSLLDKTPYKTHSVAEKVADTIIQTLPEPKPITTLTQQISPVSESYQETDLKGYTIPVGFIKDEDEFEEE